ncbi:hypothetical protein RHSIM_Rhsim11G0034800 [Rhododendron simsii]|uniref:DUF4283 domain-containing protein n=1 Tax=Rhododendron simsii TaxID=118357 RepID=A0A834G973_RHOSS|nr:hypothetical protein RHSIM_Rhsim11G0034800 [Rhododendron simsii]
MDSVFLVSNLACGTSDLVSSTCVGDVVVDLNHSSVSPRVSERKLPVSSSPKILLQDKSRVSFGVSPRVVHPRVSNLPISSSLEHGLDLLHSVTILNEDHLSPSATDTPSIRQIKELNAENTRLRRLLDSKTVSDSSNVLSWSNVVANGSTMVAGSGDGTKVTPVKMKLEYIPPVVLNDRVVVSPPADAEALGQSKWEKCIVGHFLDKRLGFPSVRNIAMNIWERREVPPATGRWSLAFGGKLLILKLWHPHLKLEKVQLSTIPLWVHFYNIPLELWTGPGFSYIASSVGRPLYVDKLTKSGKRLSFAKICVEVDCSSPLPTSFDLKHANGDVVEITIHYPWKPMVCSDCMVFGHGPSNSPKRVVAKVQNNTSFGNVGKTVVRGSQAWQVVGSLRKEAPSEVGIRPPLSLHSMPASTSMPAVSNTNSGISVADTVVQPIPVPNSGSQGVISEGLTTLKGAEVASMFAILDSSLGVPHGLTVAPQISNLMPSSNQFAALDVPDLSGTEEVYSRLSSHASLGLPDDLFEAPHASSVDIVSEIVADFVVASSQRDVSPLISIKGKSKGGGKAKVRKENLSVICGRCFPNSWLVLENSENNSPARIVLGWDPSVLEVLLVFSSAQLLCVQVTCLSTLRMFYVSAVYGANSMIDRRLLWASMRSLVAIIGNVSVDLRFFKSTNSFSGELQNPAQEQKRETDRS